MNWKYMVCHVGIIDNDHKKLSPMLWRLNVNLTWQRKGRHCEGDSLHVEDLLDNVKLATSVFFYHPKLFYFS